MVVEPVSSGATSNSSGYPQTGGIRKQPSRSCKPGDNPRSAASIVNVSKYRKQLNRLTASLNDGIVFRVLAFIYNLCGYDHSRAPRVDLTGVLRIG